MSADVIDALSWAWFFFIIWAAVHEWHSTHPSRSHSWPRRHRN